MFPFALQFAYRWYIFVDILNTTMKQCSPCVLANVNLSHESSSDHWRTTTVFGTDWGLNQTTRLVQSRSNEAMLQVAGLTELICVKLYKKSLMLNPTQNYKSID